MRTRMLVGALVAAAMIPGSAGAALPDPLSEPAAFKAPPGYGASGDALVVGTDVRAPPGALTRPRRARSSATSPTPGSSGWRSRSRRQVGDGRAAREPRGRAGRGAKRGRDDRHDGRRGVAGALAEHGAGHGSERAGAAVRPRRRRRRLDVQRRRAAAVRHAGHVAQREAVRGHGGARGAGRPAGDDGQHAAGVQHGARPELAHGPHVAGAPTAS